MELIQAKIMEEFLPEIRTMWKNSKDTFPEFLTPVSKEIRDKNESYINQKQKILSKFTNAAKKSTLTAKQREMFEDGIQNILMEETVLGVHEAMDKDTMKSFEEEIKAFLRRARQFAPDMSSEDLGQAIRNYTVHAVFNELEGCPQKCSSASFGYSMLYPVTDNFIDQENRTMEEKNLYNQLIFDEIAGREAKVQTEYDAQTVALLRYIEEEYPREKDETIYTLLLMMLNAQELSLTQQKVRSNLSYEERLDISTYKGGLSVLIDRYLVNRELTSDDYFFYLGFGFYLQLADDLQDIADDSKKGNQTLFTYDLSTESVERAVNRILYFLHDLFHDHRFQNHNMKDFLLRSSYMLIITGVLGSSEYFSNDYISQLSTYLPISPKCASKMKEELAGGREDWTSGTYLDVIDTMLA